MILWRVGGVTKEWEKSTLDTKKDGTECGYHRDILLVAHADNFFLNFQGDRQSPDKLLRTGGISYQTNSAASDRNGWRSIRPSCPADFTSWREKRAPLFTNMFRRSHLSIRFGRLAYLVDHARSVRRITKDASGYSPLPR